MAEPKVRFKKENGELYPAWKEGHLADIAEKVERKAQAASDAPIMMISQGNGFIHQSQKYSKDNAGKSLKNYILLEKGEFAYNHGASKAKPFGVAYVLKEENEARIPFVYHAFSINGEGTYWNEALNTSRMDRQLKKLVSSGARMDGLLNISYDAYMGVEINIPSVEEQEKIASFFADIDELISKTEDEIAKLQELKRGCLQKMFPREGKSVPEVRFPGFTDTWKQCKVGDHCDMFNGDRSSKYPNAQDMVSDGIPFINAGDLEDGHVNLVTCNKITSSIKDQECHLINLGVIAIVISIRCIRIAHHTCHGSPIQTDSHNHSLILVFI